MPPSIKEITSTANPVVKHLKSLSVKKYRDEAGLFVVEGLRHVEDMLAAGWTLHTLCMTTEMIAQNDGLVHTAEAMEADLFDMPPALLSRITGRDNAQHVLGVFYQTLHGLDDISESDAALWLLLEDIRDPGNLGTIIRTADAVGAAGIILAGQPCDPFSPETVRASMGSIARMKLIRSDLEGVKNWRTGWTGRIIGTHLQTETDYRTADYTLPLILAMGSEQAGMSDALTDMCDTTVKIPMPGGTESLNLAVSTGIMLYEINRARI